MALTLVQGDTAPSLIGTIRHSDTTAVDLTAATVYFQMRKSDDRRYTINAACDITAPTSGTVRYTLGPNDLNTAGDYLAQFEVHYPDGKVQTTAVNIPVTVRAQ